jgi:hypothetical protein
MQRSPVSSSASQLDYPHPQLLMVAEYYLPVSGVFILIAINVKVNKLQASDDDDDRVVCIGF